MLQRLARAGVSRIGQDGSAAVSPCKPQLYSALEMLDDGISLNKTLTPVTRVQEHLHERHELHFRHV